MLLRKKNAYNNSGGSRDFEKGGGGGEGGRSLSATMVAMGKKNSDGLKRQK